MVTKRESEAIETLWDCDWYTATSAMAMIAIAIMTSRRVNPAPLPRGARRYDSNLTDRLGLETGTTLLLGKGEIVDIALMNTHCLKKGVKDQG